MNDTLTDRMAFCIHSFCSFVLPGSPLVADVGVVANASVVGDAGVEDEVRVFGDAAVTLFRIEPLLS